MTPIRISNKTRTLEPPSDWKPSAEELEVLINGGYVHIGIRGTLFPVLSVGIEYG